MPGPRTTSADRCSRGTRQDRAFSLLEAIVVMAIVGLMAVMAVPRYTNYLTRKRADAAARRVVADLTLALRQARFAGASQTVEFNVGADSYRLVGVQDLDFVSDEYSVSLSDEPYEARIVSASFGGDATIVFDGYGAPDSGGTVVVEAGSVQYTVSVDPDTGNASIL